MDKAEIVEKMAKAIWDKEGAMEGAIREEAQRHIDECICDPGETCVSCDRHEELLALTDEESKDAETKV